MVRAASRPLPGLDRLRAMSRPAQRRSVRRPSRTTVAGERRPLITGRAVLLGALVLLLALTLAGPARQWLAGRAELAQLAAERTQLDQRIQDLQQQLRRQADPAYTAREARARLTYVLPGDRLIEVVDGKRVSGDAGTLDPGSAHSGARPPWYQGFMDSLSTADGAPPATGTGK
jgi:cell division protein FtsB